MPTIALSVATMSAYFIGGSFFVRGLLEKNPRAQLKLSSYGFAFMLLGYLGNHFIGG
jgi:hypothetical protein